MADLDREMTQAWEQQLTQTNQLLDALRKKPASRVSGPAEIAGLEHEVQRLTRLIARMQSHE